MLVFQIYDISYTLEFVTPNHFFFSCTEEIRLLELVKLVYSSIFFSVEIESVKQKTKHQRVNMPPKHELSYLENYSESLTTICTRNISLIIWLPNVSDQSSKISNCAMSALQLLTLARDSWKPTMRLEQSYK